MPRLPGLRRARERRLMTMRELSEVTGISTSTLVNLETHGQEARMVTARKLAAALRVEPDELLSGEPFKAVEPGQHEAAA
jgi:transcriptional regulator with XRE-family HTH domain